MANGICRRCQRSKSSIARNGLCWKCREPERRRVRRNQRRQEIRRPPRPPFEGKAGQVWDENGVLVGRRCTLCGEPVKAPRRTWCSEECVETWKLAVTPAYGLYQLSSLHGHVCEGCAGLDEPADYNLELDHRRPLWSLSDAERLELRWWLPFNLQLLGPRCHKAKTRREAAARAHVRRLEAQGREARYVGPDPDGQRRLFG